MVIERWLSVPGWEGLYDVSNLGRVRSLPRNTSRGVLGGRILKPSPNQSGHLTVGLSRVPEGTTVMKVHTLTALAFYGPRPDGLEVRHLDGDVLNNRAANLAYGTRSENVADSVRHGTHHKARNTHCPHGHPYSEENTVIYGGHRYCRKCRRNQQHERRQARKAES